MPQTTLSHWLRVLWGRVPALHLDAEAPFIADGAVHLPPRGAWHGHCAAAAHATAHLVYSPPRVDAGGLPPLTRALWALLEDARVEALAGREFPGLWRQWRPLHTVCAEGTDIHTLMRRLARALADPGYADPHPWVCKGRRLFYLDGAQQVMALHTSDELRLAASRLGNDIGQMRLRFDPRAYRPAPDYRDDHRWMFPAEALMQTAAPTAASDHGSARDDGAPVGPQERRTRHPEWDRLIARIRPEWATVIESPATAVASNADPDGGRVHWIDHRLRHPLLPLVRPMSERSRAADGAAFDPDAVVQWRVSRQRRGVVDDRVYRGRRPRTVRGAVWLLIDQSTSTAAPHGGGHTVLQASAHTAAALAKALHGLGLECAVAAFCSMGRHAVRMRIVKSPQAPVDATFAARLQALRPEGSTRLGTALRYATARLAAARGGARWILLLTDGEAHDIDVHDPHYLAEDARHAVRAAARLSVQTACLTFSNDFDKDACRIFGRRRIRPVADLSALPCALRGLMG